MRVEKKLKILVEEVKKKKKSKEDYWNKMKFKNYFN